MTESEARRQDDVTGARAETERFRVSVDVQARRVSICFSTDDLCYGSALGCSFHSEGLVPPCGSPSNVLLYV